MSNENSQVIQIVLLILFVHPSFVTSSLYYYIETNTHTHIHIHQMS